MKEIGNNIFIEENYAGVVLCVLRLSHGLLMVDAPYKADDQQSWRHKLANLGGGVGQLMVMLDTNTDRLLGMHLSEFPTLAHETSLEIIQNLPSTMRIPEFQARSDSEAYDQSQGVRWRLPSITFSKQVSIHWDDQPIIITHQPGGHRAAIWVHYEAEKFIFIGDGVVINQPPFLERCNLDLWMDELDWLSSDKFKDYKIISGRNGEIHQESVIKMREYLSDVKAGIEDLRGMNEPDAGIDALAASLLSKLSFNSEMTEQYKFRLVWGLRQLLQQHQTRNTEK